MRLIFLTTLLAPGFVTAVSAQPASRFEIGPVVRLDNVFIEGDASGGTTAAGVVTTFRISKAYGVEAELTRASNRIERSYDGWFISYARDPNATPEQIERLAPIARRSLAVRARGRLGGSVRGPKRNQPARRPYRSRRPLGAKLSRDFGLHDPEPSRRRGSGPRRERLPGFLKPSNARRTPVRFRRVDGRDESPERRSRTSLRLWGVGAHRRQAPRARARRARRLAVLRGTRACPYTTIHYQEEQPRKHENTKQFLVS